MARNDLQSNGKMVSAATVYSIFPSNYQSKKVKSSNSESSIFNFESELFLQKSENSYFLYMTLLIGREAPSYYVTQNRADIKFLSLIVH